MSQVWCRGGKFRGLNPVTGDTGDVWATERVTLTGRRVS